MVLAVFNAGYAEMIMKVFPPFPEPGFYPNFTGYDFDGIDWYNAYKVMAQSPEDAIIAVSWLNLICIEQFLLINLFLISKVLCVVVIPNTWS